jgi:hypothetical protein
MLVSVSVSVYLNYCAYEASLAARAPAYTIVLGIGPRLSKAVPRFNLLDWQEAYAILGTLEAVITSLIGVTSLFSTFMVYTGIRTHALWITSRVLDHSATDARRFAVWGNASAAPSSNFGPVTTTPNPHLVGLQV